MNIAMYIRLSLEDGDLNTDGKTESESISNQRKMLTDYIRSLPEFCGAEILEYCDDGYSGKNFERPGVEAMISAAKAGIIQCIVVKDLSRFGRDYITVGNYITRVFPFLGVRFISINDNYDSNNKGDIDSLDTSFKTLIYDMYSRDISAKVISAKYNLAKRGVYINPVAPYGYMRDPKDKHLLLPDPRTADVVRRIFALSADGVSTTKISCILNSENIPTPSAAKAGTSSAHANWAEDCFWRPALVHTILRDRQYIGSNVFGKRRRKQIGQRRQYTMPPEAWEVVDDCHEPLVSKELYEKAQETLGGEYQPDPGHTFRDLPLRKKVYCGVCSRAIVRHGTKHTYYACQTAEYVPHAKCCREKVYETELMEILRDTIRIHVRYAVELQRLLEQQRKKEASRLTSMKTELGRLMNLREQIDLQNQKLYESFVDGKLSRDAYITQKAELLRKQTEAESREQELKDSIRSANGVCPQAVETYCSYGDLEKLTDEKAAELLERFTIYPGGEIDVKLNYADELMELYDKYKEKRM